MRFRKKRSDPDVDTVIEEEVIAAPPASIPTSTTPPGMIVQPPTVVQPRIVEEIIEVDEDGPDAAGRFWDFVLRFGKNTFPFALWTINILFTTNGLAIITNTDTTSKEDALVTAGLAFVSFIMCFAQWYCIGMIKDAVANKKFFSEATFHAIGMALLALFDLAFGCAGYTSVYTDSREIASRFIWTSGTPVYYLSLVFTVFVNILCEPITRFRARKMTKKKK